jgi:peptide/nickel transport system substrate-binding protein
VNRSMHDPVGWRRRLAVVGLAVAVISAGCGGDDSDGAGDASAGSGSGTTADTEAILRYGTNLIGSGAPYFDPILANGNQPSRMWLDLIYDTLIHESAEGGEEPGLATEWSAPDDSTVELTLRDEVVFHDGTPFDADAVKFSFDRVLDAPPPAFPPDLRAISSVEVIDDAHVRINLSQPVAGALIRQWLKESTQVAIVSPTAVGDLGDDFANRPVGAGPMMFESYDTDQQVSLRRFDDYWGGEADLAGVDFIQTELGAPAVAALAAGDVDMAPLSSSDVAGVEAQGDFGVETQLSNATLMPAFCTSKAPFDTLEARQAVAHAIDREEIAAAAYGAEGAATDMPLSIESPYFAEDLSGAYEHDPDRARDLLDQAGVAPGTTVDLMILNLPNLVRAAEVMQAQLEEVGLDVQVQPVTNFVEDLQRLQPHMTMSAATRLESQGNWVNPGGPVNWCNYDNPELTAALVATKSADDDALADAWITAQEAYSEDLPVLFIASDPVIEAHAPGIEGVTVIHPQGQGPLLRTVYVSGE